MSLVLMMCLVPSQGRRKGRKDEGRKEGRKEAVFFTPKTSQ
jgi:hypothetical protein